MHESDLSEPFVEHMHKQEDEKVHLHLHVTEEANNDRELSRERTRYENRATWFTEHYRIDASRLKLPKSAITVCGRRWYLTIEDLVPQLLCSAALDVVALVFAVIVLEDASSSVECSGNTFAWYTRMLVAMVVCFALALLLDAGLVVSSCFVNWFEELKYALAAIYFRILVVFAMFWVALVGSILIWTDEIDSSCFDFSYKNESKMFTAVVVLCYIQGVAGVLSFGCFSRCADKNERGDQMCCDGGKAVDRLFCCCVSTERAGGKEARGDITESIAKHFTEVLQVGAHVYLAPSDAFAGLLLVEAEQRLRKEAGHVFYKPDTSSYIDEQFAASTAAVTATAAAENGDEKDGAPAPSSPSQSAVDAAEVKIQIDLQLKDIKTDMGENPYRDAREGIQHPLSLAHWHRLDEAAYFFRFAYGAYGYLLYANDHKSSFLKCSFCCGPALPSNGSISGKSVSCCAGCACMQWDYHAFLICTQIEPNNLLCAELVGGIGSSTYYLCLDHISKSIVLAIRGTLSIPDLLTDMHAREMYMDAPHEKYTIHEGIYRNAKQLVAKLLGGEHSDGKLRVALNEYPEYRLIVAGHSLGAGTASAATVVLCNALPNRDVRGLAYAPPPLFNLELARSRWLKERLTTIVYHHDIIAQLTVPNVYRLRNAMLSLFQFASQRKFRVLRGASARDPDIVFARLASRKEEVVETVREACQHHAEFKFEADDPHPYTGGSIYHIVPHKHAKRGVSAYVLDAKALQEIIWAKSFFFDHFLDKYVKLSTQLTFPAEFQSKFPGGHRPIHGF